MYMGEMGGIFGVVKKIGKGVVKVGAGVGTTLATGNPVAGVAAYKTTGAVLKGDQAAAQQAQFTLQQALAAGAIPGTQNSPYPYPVSYAVPPGVTASSFAQQGTYSSFPQWVIPAAVVIVATLSLMRK